MADLDLFKTFNELQEAFPALTDHAEIVGAGTWGIVLKQDEGTVTKVLIGDENPDIHKWAEGNLVNETSFMRLTAQAAANGFADTGFQMPVLLTEPQKLPHEKFFAAYKMTLVPGMGATWDDLDSDLADPAPELKIRFQRAGEALARFHKFTSSLPTETLRAHAGWRNGDIPEIPELDEKTAEALHRAGRYLEAHKKPAVIHGDYHGKNILLDDEGNVTGLVDFSYTGRCESFFSDFVNVPERMLPDFISGYERESGEAVDPDIALAGNICLWAAILKDEENAGKKPEHLEELKQRLAKASHITGYEP